MKKNKFFIKLLPLLFLIMVWFGFSYPFFIQSKVPFASNYQVNFFSPWSGYPELAGPVKNDAQPDVITQIYPWRLFAVEELKQGRIPLWNPYSFSGTPHLANYQSAALSPLNILFFVFSDIDAWSILVLLQPLLAGIGIYLFARSLKISEIGSLLSSISFMFCGFITTWMGYATLGYAILFLPYSLYAIQKYLSQKSIFYLILLSLSIAFSFLSGHFQISMYLLLCIIAFSIYKLFPVYNNKNSIFVSLFIFVGILLAMPQILPTIEFYTLSVRSASFQQTEIIPWSYLPTFFAPDFYGNPVTRNGWFGHYAEWNGYIGVAGLAFALLALFNYKKRDVLFFAGVSLLALLLSFNTPLIPLLMALKIPVLSTSAAGRIIVILSFSLSVLAGFGFDTLQDFREKKRKKIIWWISTLTLMFICIVAYAMFGLPDSQKTPIALSNLKLPIGIIVIVFAYIVGILLIKSKKILVFLSIVLLVIASFDMLRFAKKWQAFDPKELVFKDVATTAFYKSQNTEKRFLTDSTAENSVYYKLQTLGGYDPLYPEAYGEFIKYVNSEELIKPDRSVVSFPKDGMHTPEAINFLGVSYIIEKISDEGRPWGFPFKKYPLDQFSKIYDDKVFRVYENKKAFPRTFLAYDTITSGDKKEQLINMFSQDLSKIAVTGGSIQGLNKNGRGNAKIVEYLPNKITIETNSSGSGLLVLTDNYYPGWKANVNNVRQKIYKIDYNFRGVVVPEGKSRVVMEYLPQSFFVGIYLSLIGVLIIATSFVLQRIRRFEFLIKKTNIK